MNREQKIKKKYEISNGVHDIGAFQFTAGFPINKIKIESKTNKIT